MQAFCRHIADIVKPDESTAIAGKSFIFTGVLSDFTRDEAESLVKNGAELLKNRKKELGLCCLW